jgi:hypothetical protein
MSVTSSLARCAHSVVDPDEWFPVASKPALARAEAGRALALCRVCPVRAECLELSMRAWHTGGRHGIWGGFIAADRAAARAEWMAGVPATALVKADPEDLGDHGDHRRGCRKRAHVRRGGSRAGAVQPP